MVQPIVSVVIFSLIWTLRYVSCFFSVRIWLVSAIYRDGRLKGLRPNADG